MQENQEDSRAQGAREVKERCKRGEGASSGIERGGRPCNLRRDIAANIGITHCSSSPNPGIKPPRVMPRSPVLLLVNGHTPVTSQLRDWTGSRGHYCHI